MQFVHILMRPPVHCVEFTFVMGDTAWTIVKEYFELTQSNHNWILTEYCCKFSCNDWHTGRQ